jgi:hypothetical protein
MRETRRENVVKKTLLVVTSPWAGYRITEASFPQAWIGSA